MIKCFCIIENKALLLSGGKEGLVKVWNLLSFTNRDALEGHRGEVCCLVHMQDSVLNE